jgi:hypothetical protein
MDHFLFSFYYYNRNIKEKNYWIFQNLEFWFDFNPAGFEKILSIVL